MVLIEYFHVIGCCLIILCYVDHYVRDLFMRDTITPQKVSHIHLNPIKDERYLGDIIHVISYINHTILEYDEPFFQPRNMEEVRNRNMAESFDSSLFSVLDESIWEWLSCYTCLWWMFVPRKPHPFVREYHTVVCELSKVIYHVEIIERKYRPRGMG